MTIDERIATELRRHAPEVDEHKAWDRIRSAAPARKRTRAIMQVSMSAAAIGFLAIGFIVASNYSSGPGPATDPRNPYVGTWITTDLDGSTPTMVIRVSGSEDVEMIVHDDFASVCSGAPSTMSGTGRLQGDTELVIPTPVLTCDDGTQPDALSGPSLEVQLQDLTFTPDPGTDTLTDNLGSVWRRDGAEDPKPEPTAMGWWPQSNLEEVKEAQRLADAGDPDYTWQVDATLAADDNPLGAEIFARFIEEELGWEEFVSGWSGSGYLSMGAGGGVYQGVTFIRCVPGETNPLNSLYADAPTEIRGCAPTIDEFRYETVSIDVSQPGLRGPEGIWVVDRWEMRQSKSSDPGSLYALIYPEVDGQVEQFVPPSDAEVTGFLEEFLGARVDGEGAEPYLPRELEESAFSDIEVPLLYATTRGVPYERSEIERVQGPVWPTGWSEYKVRLFAKDGTTVEQYFHLVRQWNGQLGLVYGYNYDELPTTENGQSVPVPFSLLDGEVTFAAAPPWRTSDPSDPSDTFIRLNWGRDDHVVIATDPLPAVTDCKAPAPADAEALARWIMADPNAETTGTVPVRIAGLDALQMDVDVDVDAVVWTEENSSCRWNWSPDQADRYRMRLYLIDYPDGPSPVLAIAVIAAPETDFERVLAEATPIVESLEIHSP